MKTLMLRVPICLAVIIASSPAVMAQAVAQVSQALPFVTQGKVELTQPAASVVTPPKAATAPTAITAGGKISTSADGSAAVILSGVGTVRLGRDTEIQIPVQPAQHSLELLKGKLFLQINAEELQGRKAGEFRLKTPSALLAVKGTRFFVDCEKISETIGLHQGGLKVLEPSGNLSVLLAPNQAVSVSPGKITAPRPLTPGEKNSASTYDDIGVVTTPLVTALSQQGQTFGYKVFRDGSVVDLDWDAFKATMPAKEHILLHAFEGGGSDRAKASEMLPDGRLRLAFFNKTTSEFKATLHFKGRAWRAKNVGPSSLGPLIGLRLSFKAKNIASISSSRSNRSELSASIMEPTTHPHDVFWEQSMIVPLGWLKSGENSGYQMYLQVSTADALDAAGARRTDDAEVIITECVLVSQLK